MFSCHFFLVFGVVFLFSSFFFIGITEKLVICAEIGSVLRSCDSQPTLYLKGWKAVWHMIEDVYTKAVDYGDVWKDDKNSQRKRRTLSDLLDSLKRSGLSMRKAIDEVV